MKQAFPPAVPSINYGAPPAGTVGVPRKKNILLWIVGAFLLVMFGAGVGLGALVIYKRRAPLTWHLTLAVDSDAPNRAAAAKQAADVIERRISAFGLRNFRVTPQDNGRIMLDLPKVTDPQRVKLLISAGGRLELVHVISPSSPSPVQSYATKEEAIASLNNNGAIPPNRRVLPYINRDTDSLSSEKWVVVEAPAIVNGSELRDASAGPSTYGEEYEIFFSLNKTGADKFGSWTGANIDKYLGVVLNDEVKSVAFIKSQISDQGVINGRFTKQSAEDLALVLKSGALPAKITFIEERTDK